MKISFIIPIYKVEQYLAECVQSILRQTYKDYEVLLVDDGSPDNCPALCDEWAKRDTRVKALHKPNGGLSDARNFGLRHATGDYVIFVDSDDFWDNCNSLKSIALMLERNNTIDVLFFNVFYYDNITHEKSMWPEYTRAFPEVCTSTEAMNLMLDSGTVPMSAWCKVIKRTVLQDNGISFQKGIYGEDIPWFISLMYYSKIISFTNDYVYAYRQNVNTSITRSNKPKHIADLKYIIESECELTSKRIASTTWKDAIYSFLAYNYSILLSQYNYVDGSERRNLWLFLAKYKYLLNYTLHQKVKKVCKLVRIVGIKPSAFILNVYLNHK